jgi:nitrogen PTS system EIIA component
MNLCDFVVRDAIISDLKATEKQDVIRELMDALRQTGHVQDSDFESVVKAIIKREELGSTGIGKGVAVPHTKHPSVPRLVGTVGLSQKGVNFEALDGEPVYIFFLLVSPPDKPGDHLRALENISRHLKDNHFCRCLQRARSREELAQLLQDADQDEFA